MRQIRTLLKAAMIASAATFAALSAATLLFLVVLATNDLPMSVSDAIWIAAPYIASAFAVGGLLKLFIDAMSFGG